MLRSLEKIAEDVGSANKIVDHRNTPEIKRRESVTVEIASCHTAIVASYTIQGYVPLSADGRLLARRPKGTLKIVVPGVPRGTPGLEMPDRAVDEFQVRAFDKDGRATSFALIARISSHTILPGLRDSARGRGVSNAACTSAPAKL